MRSLNDLITRADPFEFVFDEFSLKGEWYKWRTTSPQYQRAKAEKIAALPQMPADAKPEDAEKILQEIEKGIRTINAQIMKDTIKSWDAVEEFARTVDQGTFESLSPRVQRLYKQIDAEDPERGHELIDPALADRPQPVPLTIEVFEELPAFFSRLLGEHFQKLREQVLNPTKPDSSQSG